MDAKAIPVYGSLVEDNPMVTDSNPFVQIPGLFKNQRAPLSISKDTLSKHTMLIGGTGCGKSNVFYHFVSQIKKKLRQNDVMIIFDTKGDYYKECYTSGDIVISNDDRAIGESGADYWNIFNESSSDDRIEENVSEITKSNIFT